MGFCKICTNPNRDAIEESLASGEPRATVAKRFGLRAGALTWHVQKKHPPAESPEDLDDEPYIIDGRGSYDWIMRQSRARALRSEKLLGETRMYDPFFFGSELDVEKATWFRDAVVRHFAEQIKGTKPHLRRLHYLCVTAPRDPRDPRSVKWPDGRLYENTVPDWNRLQRRQHSDFNCLGHLDDGRRHHCHGKQSRSRQQCGLGKHDGYGHVGRDQRLNHSDRQSCGTGFDCGDACYSCHRAGYH